MQGVGVACKTYVYAPLIHSEIKSQARDVRAVMRRGASGPPKLAARPAIALPDFW
jgi:hypothetical protein